MPTQKQKRERFAAQVRAARINMQLSPAEFAKQAGVAPQSIYRWEAGQCLPRMSSLRKVAEFIGSDVKEYS